MYMDQDNVPFYIGKGRGKRYLPGEHKKGRSHTSCKVRKLGVDNVKVHFLHKDISEEEAIHWEKYWIQYLGRKDNGTGQLTNHTDGGEGVSGSHPIFSNEHKRNISKAMKGRKFSAEHRKNLSESHKGKKRKPFSDETKQRMRGPRPSLLGNQNARKYKR
ncbi:hypothetical protein LCGC14_2082750 [marine sediment metagenome]|uniref:Nuclease associated modular domain-containing protein n=1 Tax=marine sediment metagenome TaxID=412755 RepID=A0A0F9EEY5_9ZZZZ